MEDKSLATRVILVRHGETSFNVEGRAQGHLDQSFLTEKGLIDAHQVGVALTGIPIDAIYVSPLKRARQTADAILETLASRNGSLPQPQVLNTLIEVSLPLWEGMLFDEVKVKFPQGYHDWHHQPHKLRMVIPGSEDPQPFFPVLALYDQAQHLWQEILPQHPDQTLVLIGHSGINRALISTALGLTPERYHTLQQANCNITVLNFPDGTLHTAQLESHNLTAHIGMTLPKPRSGYHALRLILVRHGETDWNRQGRFQGQIDVPLNLTGQHQGQQAAEFLQAIEIDFAISSPMKRPLETAELILKHHPNVPLTLEDNFREISHGSWEGCLESEIESAYPGELDRWHRTPAEVQMPEGENLQQVWDRATAAWDQMVTTALADSKDCSVGLVVAHDAINKVILCHVTGLGPEHIWNFKQGNGAVSVIDYSSDGTPILQSMNITTHLAGGILDKTAAGAL